MAWLGAELAVEFDGEGAGEPQLAEEVSDGGTVGEVSRFAVDGYLHKGSPTGRAGRHEEIIRG